MKRMLAGRVATMAICAVLAVSATAAPAAAQVPRWLANLLGDRASSQENEPASPQPAPTDAPKVDADPAGGTSLAVAHDASSPAASPTPAAATAPLARADAGDNDVSRVVLSALACSSPGPGACAANPRGSALTALASGAGAMTDRQLVDGAFQSQMSPVWSEQQQQAIVMIGYYSAAAALCPGAELDAEDVARVLHATFAPAPGAAEEQLRYRHDALTMHIGMATGMAMGAHIASVPTFCAEARANRHAFATPLLRERAPTAEASLAAAQTEVRSETLQPPTPRP